MIIVVFFPSQVPFSVGIVRAVLSLSPHEEENNLVYFLIPLELFTGFKMWSPVPEIQCPLLVSMGMACMWYTNIHTRKTHIRKNSKTKIN